MIKSYCYFSAPHKYLLDPVMLDEYTQILYIRTCGVWESTCTQFHRIDFRVTK